MNAEQTVQFSRFYQVWSEKPPELRPQIEEEYASFKLETHHQPDPYCYVYDSSGNAVTTAGVNVKRVTSELSGALGLEEHQAFCTYEKLGREDNEARNPKNPYLMWVSRPFEGVYDDTKIIFTEVIGQGSERLLFNRAFILSDFTELETYSLAKKLHTHVDSFRTTPVALEIGERDWKDYLEELIPNLEFREQIQLVRSGADLKAKAQALEAAQTFYSTFLTRPKSLQDKIVYLPNAISYVNQSQEFGAYLASCPPALRNKTNPGPTTILGQVLEHSVIIKSMDWKKGQCRLCNEVTSVGDCRICLSCQNKDTEERAKRAA